MKIHSLLMKEDKRLINIYIIFDINTTMFKIKGQNNKYAIIDSKLSKIKQILTFAIDQTK